MSISYVFLRDDDVWKLDTVFLDLFDLLRKKGIPVIYGIIPGRLDDKLARFLRQAKNRNPKAFDIVQHGFKHINHAPPSEKKYEFGPQRTFLQQYHDIEKGMNIMQRQFGRALTPGFIPPYHADDENTIKAIEALHIPLFSARKKINIAHKSFIDLPAHIWLNRANREGTLSALGFKGLLAKTAGIFNSPNVVGLVYRQSVIKTSVDVKAMKAFLSSLARWRDQGKVRFVLFSEILKIHSSRALRAETGCSLRSI